MNFMDLFKNKPKQDSALKGMDIPSAPSTKEELPSFPSQKETKEGISPLERAEKEAVKSQQIELDVRDDLTLKKPIFVYIDLYKEMLKEISLIKNNTKEGSDNLARIDEFREDQEKEFKKWGTQIKDIQKKLTYVDKTLFGSKTKKGDG